MLRGMSSRFEPVPLQFPRQPEPEQEQAAQQFLDVVRRRRSIRKFSPEPVRFSLIEQAIRAAATAPSGANQQPWRFVVVSDHAMKQKIREAAEKEERKFYENAPREWL